MPQKNPEQRFLPENRSFRFQTINLDTKFGFGHKFFEVEAGVIQAAQKLAGQLNRQETAESKRNSRLMRQFSDLAILSQRLAGDRQELSGQASLAEDLLKIQQILNEVLAVEKSSQMWQAHLEQKKKRGGQP